MCPPAAEVRLADSFASALPNLLQMDEGSSPRPPPDTMSAQGKVLTWAHNQVGEMEKQETCYLEKLPLSMTMLRPDKQQLLLRGEWRSLGRSNSICITSLLLTLVPSVPPWTSDVGGTVARRRWRPIPFDSLL
ncbi:hypothetical protein CRENBAI_014621 [Crenichthys baileyi]|uniref:Uncharacterized protein n=1 Tax=Crenichthys baileyi TaxID=28760 RepID=A0AAV9SBE6_9TELE